VREFKFLYALALVTIIGASLSACAQGQSTQASMTDVLASPPQHESFSGSYLAGRFAQRQQDWESAQHFMNSALDYDKGNEQMIQRTFLLALGSGNFESAKALAEKALASGEGDEMALIFLSCEAISRNDFKASKAFLDKLPSEGFGQYTKPLLTAWSLAGEGKKEAALKLLSDNATPDDPTYRMHAGMIEEMSGNDKKAEEHYRVVMENGLTLHTAVMVGNFFLRIGKPAITHTIYEGLDKVYPLNPFVSALSNRDPKQPVPSNAARAADGAALALFDLATLLYEKRAYDSAQIYDSLVQLLQPASPFAKMMMGDISALHEQYDKAIASYNAVEPESLVYWLSRIRVTEIYETTNQNDEAIKMLTALSGNPATRVQALVSLGDIYRRHEKFENAVASYDDALAAAGKLTEEHWPIIYARGMAEERLNRWDLAEKDLLQALSFQPDNPMILNFIAYSWANQGVHLDKALAYAKHAAALRPNDGYILDSYGWTLFRLTKYKECINWLEQAVSQIPGDSVLLDHLGDAYWLVGRKNEARYQWKHAHDLSQDPGFKTVVDQKLQHGITVPSQVSSNEQPKL
jgi:tetratricopeptide (TPR) repeat protein